MSMHERTMVCFIRSDVGGEVLIVSSSPTVVGHQPFVPATLAAVFSGDEHRCCLSFFFLDPTLLILYNQRLPRFFIVIIISIHTFVEGTYA